MRPIQFSLNGKPVSIEVLATDRLIDILRNSLGCYEVKEGCGAGECGACTILLDGMPVTSCIMLACQVNGRSVTTVRGIPDTWLDRIEKAMQEAHAVQCGFCSPGFVVSIYALLQRNPSPSREETQVALAGNLCRCTGYESIFKAVERLSNPNAGGRP